LVLRKFYEFVVVLFLVKLERNFVEFREIQGIYWKGFLFASFNFRRSFEEVLTTYSQLFISCSYRTIKKTQELFINPFKLV
jgi:hypothetical protein